MNLYRKLEIIEYDWKLKKNRLEVLNRFFEDIRGMKAIPMYFRKRLGNPMVERAVAILDSLRFDEDSLRLDEDSLRFDEDSLRFDE